MSVGRPPRRFQIGRAAIDRCGFGEAIDRIVALARATRPSLVVTPNVDHILRLERDSAFRAAYAEASLILADGMPLVVASRLLGEPLPGRVAGADLVPALCARAAAEGLKLFFLGAPPGVARRAADLAQQAHAGLKLPGSHCPPLGFERDAALDVITVAELHAANPDIVLVALGSPKQELWIVGHLALFDHGVFIGVGAAIEFLAGTLPRAPLWVQHSGMEWVHRLMSDPRRLWRRYLSNVAFLGTLWAEWRRRRATLSR